MPAITSANLANAIVKMVAAESLPALRGSLVMGNLVNRDFEPVLANAGDTVNVPIPPSMTVQNIGETGTVNTQNPNVGNAQIVLNRHFEASFSIPDVTKAFASPELLKLYLEPAVSAIAEQVETDLLATASSFTANPAVGTYGAALTESSIDTAETTLFTKKVPMSAPRYLVVDPTAYGQLRQIARFSEFQTAGEAGLKALVDGQVGRLKNFYVFRSQFVPKAGTAPVQTSNLAFSKNALGLVIRRLPKPLPGTGAIAEYAEAGNFGVRVVMSYTPNTLAQQFTVDILYGYGILRNDHGVLVRS
ncbi:MAG: hypothetical protein FJW40_08730 [Acidobacteria bacterium]|nr:hypothetical protein [Acidobacteriota bacterium]